MLSRVADAVYWTARYLERAANTARFIEVNVHMGLDAPIAFSDQWEPLVAITGSRPAFLESYGSATRENVIQYLTFDVDNANSILSCLGMARENARSVREIISSETWEQINRFFLKVNAYFSARRALAQSQDFYADVRNTSYLIAGTLEDTMSHGEAWHFHRLGRFLERADNTSRLVDVKYFLLLPSPQDVGSAIDELEWAALLRSATALEMFRKRHGRIEPDKVVDFLVLDREFPRAILFSLTEAERSLQAIIGSKPGEAPSAAESLLGGLRFELASTNVYEIIAGGLHEFLDGLQGRLIEVGNEVSASFFALRPMTDPGATGGGEQQSDLLSGYQSQRGPGGDRGHAGDFGE